MPETADFDPQDPSRYEPTGEEVAQMRTSSPEERAGAQAMVLRKCSGQWQKVAKIVGDLLEEFERTYPHLPFALLQATMEKLEDLGEVEIVGDVWSMRHSEIRLVNQRKVQREA